MTTDIDDQEKVTAERPTTRRWWWLLVVVAIVAGLLFWRSQDQNEPVASEATRNLQERLDRAATDQGSVELEDGVYSLDLPITVPQGVTLRGDGATLRWTESAREHLVLESGSRLDGITVRSGGLAQTSIAVAAGARDVEISDCAVTGARKELVGIGITSGSGLTIRGTTIQQVQNGIQVLGHTSDLVIEDVGIEKWTTRGIRIHGDERGSSRKVRIANVQIGPNVGTGRARYPITTTSTGAWHEGISVEDSTITGRDTAFDDESSPGTADQISITKTRGVLIRGNKSLNGGERGLNVTAASDVVVEDNEVERADTVGIGIGANGAGKEVSDVTVRGNTVVDSGLSRQETAVDLSLAAIRLTAVTTGVIDGNQIVATAGIGSQKYGITLDGVSGVEIGDNAIDGELQDVQEAVDGETEDGRE